MPDTDTPEEPMVQEAPTPEGAPQPEQPPVPDPVLAAVAELAAGDPLCLVCGATLRIERRTPDFATHYTQVCDTCGYRQKLAG